MSSLVTQTSTPFVSSASPSSSSSGERPGGGRGRLELSVCAAGYVAIPHDEIDGWRRKAPSVPGLEMSPGFLKPVDEQTVCVFLATAQAMVAAGLDASRFKEWGVVAAPRFLGRVFDAGTFHKFLQIGGGAVSVHLIPQQSQHAVSGAISVAFGMQGPNFGVAGGPGGAAEALLTGFSAYDPSVVPGLWLCLSEFDPEATPSREGKHTVPAVCHALAIALSLDPNSAQGLNGPRLALEWSLSEGRVEATEGEPSGSSGLTVASLAGPIVAAARGAASESHVWNLGGGYRLEVSGGSAASLGGEL